MAGLFSNDPKTPEGKYPIVLRRDGSPLVVPYFVMVLKDPCAAAALHAYANAAVGCGFDGDYIGDVRLLAEHSARLAAEDANLPKPTSDPDAPRHRKDDPALLAWARSLHQPGS